MKHAVRKFCRSSALPLGCAGLLLAAPLAAQDTITIHGSDTMLLLNRELAAEYAKDVRTVEVSVLGGGSEIGIAALMAGKTDIAAASRPMREAEIQAFEERTGARPQEVVVALDGLAVYVHDYNPLSTLSVEQLGRILTGEVRNWREVGGLDRPIDVYNRDEGSGTRTFMQEHALGGRPFAKAAHVASTTARLVASVSCNPNAIGYGGIAYARNVHILRLSTQPGEPGVYPSHEAVASGAYPLSRALYYYINPASMDDDLRRFVDWVEGADGQAVVAKIGYYEAPHGLLAQSSDESRPPALRGRIPLTPASMKQLGFQMAMACVDVAAELRPGQTMVTLRFNPDGSAIRRIESLSMRIGEDIDLPLTLAPDLSVQFALKRALLDTTTVCLAEAGAPHEGAVYEVALRDFSPTE